MFWLYSMTLGRVGRKLPVAIAWCLAFATFILLLVTGRDSLGIDSRDKLLRSMLKFHREICELQQGARKLHGAYLDSESIVALRRKGYLPKRPGLPCQDDLCAYISSDGRTYRVWITPVHRDGKNKFTLYSDQTEGPVLLPK